VQRVIGVQKVIVVAMVYCCGNGLLLWQGFIGVAKGYFGYIGFGVGWHRLH